MDKHYKACINNRYKILKTAKIEFDNNDLWKIFEWFCCIKLSEMYNKQFYNYEDIDPEFKEENQMTCSDTGIDLCDLDTTIVQCKLRNKTLTWQECSTFFGSQNIFKDEEVTIRWKKLIICRNDDCKLSHNLNFKKNMFTDVVFSKEVLLEYCENLTNEKNISFETKEKNHIERLSKRMY